MVTIRVWVTLQCGMITLEGKEGGEVLRPLYFNFGYGLHTYTVLRLARRNTCIMSEQLLCCQAATDCKPTQVEQRPRQHFTNIGRDQLLFTPDHYLRRYCLIQTPADWRFKSRPTNKSDSVKSLLSGVKKQNSRPRIPHSLEISSHAWNLATRLW